MRSKAGNAFQRGLGVALTLCLAFQLPLSARASSVSDVAVEAASYTTASAAVDGMVRVYLSSLGSPTTLTLTVAGNYTLSTGASLASGETLTIGFNSSSGAITLTRNGVKTGMGTSFSILRHSTGGTNGITISQARKPGNPYPGDVAFRAVYQSGGYYKLYTIVNVYIENYLYGVLPYEIGSGAPAEALKAQAVAARTYTVRMMNSRASGYYDVVDTTGDQTYNGTPSGCASCTAAVDATKGVVLKNGGSYTATYYSASNGGQTESIRNIWGTTGCDYLDVHDDPFDYANPDSTVKKATVYANCASSNNNSSLMALLKTKAVTALASAGYAATGGNTSLTTIKSIVAHTPKYASPSRLYTKMDFSLTAATVNAAGSSVTASVTVTCGIFTELESLLSMSIQSGSNELWTVVKGANTFTLEARRYGHGLGLSQRGAIYMGRLGYTYDDILGFYYPGCTRVGTTFTNTILAADSTEEITTEETSVDIGDEDADGSACTAVVKLASSTGTLAIRGSKSDSGSILGVLSNSSRVTVYAGDGTWCLIKFGAIVGYVPFSALTVTGTVPESSDMSVTAIAGFATVTASTYLNLRESGSYSAGVVSTAPGGAVLTVLSKTSSWAYVQYGTTVAYACADFLSYSDTYPGAAVSSGSTTATVTTEDDAGTALRATASTDGEVLAMLAEGAVVTVTNDDGSWAAVTCNGVAGYVLSGCLTPGDGTDGTDGTSDDTPDGTDTAGLTAVVATQSGSLNMRSEARAGSTILTTIPKGAAVTVTAKGETWCAVTYNGYAGYVMTVYLQLGGNHTAQDDTTETTATVTTESGSLNLRQLPKTGSTILAAIPRLATVTVHTRGAEWCSVNYNGVEGYVMTVFLTIAETVQETPTDTPSPSPSGTPTDTPLPGEAPTDTPPASVTPTDTPSPSPSATPTDTPPPDDVSADGPGVLTAVVSTDSGSLNLRTDMLPGSRVLTRIPSGTTITILQKLSAWSLTTYGVYIGYVMNSYLTFRTDPVPAVSDSGTATVVTASGSLNLRASASTGADILTTIPRLATVTVLTRGDDWCQVAYGAYGGYVQTAFLSFAGSTGDTGNADSTEDTDGADASATVTAWVYTASGSLNLRASASSSAQVLTAIPRLAQVTLLSQDVTWCRLSYGGYTGYAMTAYLTTVKPAELTVGGDTETAAPTAGATQEPTQPATTGTPEPTITNTPTPAGTVAEDPTLAAPENVLLAQVTPPDSAATLSLWASCTEQTGWLMDMIQLTQVTVVRKGDTWCEVNYYGQIGFCLTKGLTMLE